MASRIHSFRSESFRPLYNAYTPHKKKPKPWRNDSASQMHHFDKFSADNIAYLARPEQHEYKGSSRKGFLRKNIYFLSTWPHWKICSLLLLFLWHYNCASPLPDRRINVLHTRRFGRWLSHYINPLLTRKLVSESCVLTDRLLCSNNTGSEVRLFLSVP